MKIIIQGMLDKIRSSRKLAKACRENFVFMYLAEKVKPDFRTISRFRKDNPKFVKRAFQKTISLADKHNLVDLSFIAIDGSTLKAYAGKRRYVDKKSLDKLGKAIDKMVDEDIALDELEDQMFDDREDGLTGIDRRNLKKIVREYNQTKDKEKAKKNVKKAKNELEKYSLKKVSISDPESRMMQSKKLYSELSYSAQLSVSKDQIIVANDMCQDKHDAHQFIPQINNIKENVSLRDDTKIALDCGYSDGQNIKFAEDNNIDLYVPSRAQAQSLEGKEQTLNHDLYDYDWKKDEIIYKNKRFKYRGFYYRKNTDRKILIYKSDDGTKKDVPEFFRERLRMKEKMEKPESKSAYNLRKVTVEPVYGHLKQNLGFREFLLRGLKKVKIEFDLVCIAHNLQKIWRFKTVQSC